MSGSKRARLLAATSALATVLLGFPVAPAHATPASGVAVAVSPTGNGTWILQGDGTVQSSGDAAPLGSSARHMVDLAPGPAGGYWLLAADGTVEAHGVVPDLGSVSDPTHRPFVGIAPTRSGHGYWLVAADGAVYGFGDALFHGSLSHGRSATPLVGIAPAPDSGGYWLLARDGTVTGFGSATASGSAGPGAVAIVAGPTDRAYWVALTDGRVLAFGGATPLPKVPVDGPVADVAVRPQRDRYVVVTAPRTEPSDADFDRLAQCESGGQWNLDTGNGYYGGLQFRQSTWDSLGGTGKPSDHPRADQIEIGRREWRAHGWGAWPTCSRQVGLA